MIKFLKSLFGMGPYSERHPLDAVTTPNKVEPVAPYKVEVPTTPPVEVAPAIVPATLAVTESESAKPKKEKAPAKAKAPAKPKAEKAPAKAKAPAKPKSPAATKKPKISIAK